FQLARILAVCWFYIATDWSNRNIFTPFFGWSNLPIIARLFCDYSHRNVFRIPNRERSNFVFLITLSIVVFLIFVLNSGVAELLSLVTDKGPTNFGAEHHYYSAIAGVLQLPEQLLTGILGGYAALVLGISRNRLKSMHE
ncbi:MAG: hypothetical protein WBM67_07150, partial [Sedimenticolaceae bacterium]